jgi:exodeoxyribonuclease VII small subunit
MTETKFEDSMKRLEEIVQDLEKGDVSLEEALKAFEEGMNLVGICSTKLEEAERKVQILIKEADGRITRKPFDVDEENGEE